MPTNMKGFEDITFSVSLKKADSDLLKEVVEESHGRLRYEESSNNLYKISGEQNWINFFKHLLDSKREKEKMLEQISANF